MIVKSIGIQLDTVADRHQLLKAVNNEVLPTLQRDRGLIDATLLDFQESGIMGIFSFDETLVGEDLNLSERLRKGAAHRGLELDSERFLERNHPVLA